MGRNVGLSFGSLDYAISEIIDVGDMMMGLEETTSLYECSSSPLTYACKRSPLDTMHHDPKKLGKKARYAKDIIMTTCDDADGDDVLINEVSVSQLQFSSRHPNFTSHAQMVQTKPGKKSGMAKRALVILMMMKTPSMNSTYLSPSFPHQGNLTLVTRNTTVMESLVLGGVRFIPCLECNGSCKVRKEEENGYLRCSQCNENGLIQCLICILSETREKIERREE